MVSLALRFRPLFWMDVLVRQLGTAPAVKSGETGLARYFWAHISSEIGIVDDRWESCVSQFSGAWKSTDPLR
jgi:hypothetical protein